MLRCSHAQAREDELSEMLAGAQSSLEAMQRLYAAAQNQLFELQSTREEAAAGRQVNARQGCRLGVAQRSGTAAAHDVHAGSWTTEKRCVNTGAPDCAARTCARATAAVVGR